MKIAVWHNLPSGGGKRALFDHVRGLAARGHTIEAWCPPTADQSYFPLNQIVPEHVVPLNWYRPRHTVSRLRPAYWNMAAKIKAMDEHCRQCADEINRGAFDVLFSGSCFIFAATSIGRHVNVPRAIYLQEPNRPMYEALPRLIWAAPVLMGKHWWTPHNLKVLLADNARALMMRLKVREEIVNAQAYDMILVNSYFSRENVLRVYGLDAKVCYLGVDTNHFDYRHLKREEFVIGVGAFNASKNVRLVIEALGRIRANRPRLVWVANVADPQYHAAMQQLAQSQQVELEVILRGEDRLVDLLNRATLMIYTPRLEPFGLAPVEANACGCPVIAVAEGGVRESIIDGYNGLLVENAPHVIGAAVERLLQDKSYARQLGEDGHRRAIEYFSLETSVSQVEKRLMECVIGK